MDHSISLVLDSTSPFLCCTFSLCQVGHSLLLFRHATSIICSSNFLRNYFTPTTFSSIFIWHPLSLLVRLCYLILLPILLPLTRNITSWPFFTLFSPPLYTHFLFLPFSLLSLSPSTHFCLPFFRSSIRSSWWSLPFCFSLCTVRQNQVVLRHLIIPQARE